jgi:hypothetical protein
MGEPSRLYKLIDERLDDSLAEFVAARRPHTAWRAIAADVHAATGILVSAEILRQWFADRLEITATVRAA